MDRDSVACLGLALVLALTACGGETNESDNLSDSAEATDVSTDVAAFDTGPVNAVCGSQETFDSIKDLIFDEVTRASTADPVPLNDLRRSVGVRMEVPLLLGKNDELQRTDCSGRLVIGIPPGARAAFGGDKELKADIEYFIQPAADGAGSVISADGFGYVMQRILAADVRRAQISVRPERDLSSNSSWSTPASDVRERDIANPSFNCSGKLKNVEQMICSSGELARKDRALSEAFKERLAEYSGEERQYLLRSQRSLLAVRARCTDKQCISEWYDDALADY